MPQSIYEEFDLTAGNDFKSKPFNITEEREISCYLEGAVSDIVRISLYATSRDTADVDEDGMWTLVDRAELTDGDPYEFIARAPYSHVYAHVEATTGSLTGGFMRIMSK